jgi:heat shock protein HslJ
VSASPSPAAGTTPVGTWAWQSTQPASGSPVVAADPARYTVTFQADGSLQVRADCNQILGTYTVSGSSLMVQLGPSTLVACPPDSQADDFVAGLNQVASYSFDSGMLTLTLTSGGQMHFAAMPAPALTGPTWQLTAYNNGRGGVQSILADTQPTASFGTDAQVSGSGGCNTFSGPYQSTASTLSIGPLASTFKACEQPIMDQETAYLTALQQTSTYRFENRRLVLVNASGATQAIFDR